MSTLEDVGVIIHVLRVIRGLSQGELGRLSDVRNSSISNYERGKSVPKLETLEKLAKGLELPISAMEETQEFIRRMRSRGGGGSGFAGAGLRSHELPGDGGTYPPRDPTALRAELLRISDDAGRVMSEIVRLALGALAFGPPAPESQDAGNESSDDEAPRNDDADRETPES